MQIVLELAGEGQDVAAAAAAFRSASAASSPSYEGGPVRVAGREAFRLRGRRAAAALISTFLAHRGAVYQLSCAGAERRRLEALCTVTTRSFRPMTPELLAQVTGLRLALVEARAGETLARARQPQRATPGAPPRRRPGMARPGHGPAGRRVDEGRASRCRGARGPEK